MMGERKNKVKDEDFIHILEMIQQHHRKALAKYIESETRYSEMPLQRGCKKVQVNNRANATFQTTCLPAYLLTRT